MKLVVTEPGPAGGRDTWEAADSVVSSQLLYPEARAALGRATRSERLGRNSFSAARRLIERLSNDIAWIDLTDLIARQAGELAEEHRLRVYDAMHLASALTLDDEAVLVAADGELLAAATALDLSTAALG